VLLLISSMSVKRAQLIGKKVYNPDGEYVGEVEDVAFALGEAKITLVIKGRYGGTVETPWDNVAAAKDIVILKEAVSVPTPPAPTIPPEEEKKGIKISLPSIKFGKEEKICPYCGKPATWIPQYQRWYCYNCGKYID